jgi:hypothetical protein
MVDRDPLLGRDPKVGRGTRIFNIEFYESPKFRDQRWVATRLCLGTKAINFSIQFKKIFTSINLKARIFIVLIFKQIKKKV